MITTLYFLALAALLLPFIWSLGIEIIALLLIATFGVAKIFNNITEIIVRRKASTHYASFTCECVGSWHEQDDYIFFDIVKNDAITHQMIKRDEVNLVFVDTAPHVDYWINAYNNLFLLLAYNYTDTGINLYLREADKRSD